MRYCALTIAGSDSSGGAGIQADLKTFAALGVYGTSVITAVTAQNSLGVQGVTSMDGEVVQAQMAAVLSDIKTDAVKLGMLLNPQIIAAVADTLRHFQSGPIVADTVMLSKNGRYLLLPEVVEIFKQRIIPLTDVLTPNLPEAEILTGIRVHDAASMLEAAKRLHALGGGSIVIKGGHLDGEAMDLLYDGRQSLTFSAPRIKNVHTHGTGCTYSAAIAAFLARGCQLQEAVGLAKQYMNMAIRHGFRLGAGIGPLHHFKKLYEAAGITD